jgi:hypothetical protein
MEGRGATGEARPGEWAALGLMAAGSVVLLFAAEWLFFVTKPSFLSGLPLRRQLLVLAVSPLLPACAAAALVALLFGLSRAARPLRPLAWSLALLAPALVVAFTAFLMAANFTGTVLGFGIQTSRGVARAAWLAVLAALVVWAFRLTGRMHARLLSGLRPRVLRSAAAAAAAAVGGFGTAAILFATRHPPHSISAVAGRDRLPNILLIGGDGLDAEHLSGWGYARKTSPQIDALLAECLVARNAFANAENTGASTISILTGKLPTETGVIYPPNILRGRGAYEHLPGILRRLGYETVQLSLRHYADALDLNLRGGFDAANFRRAADDALSDRLHTTLGGDVAYFVERVAGRVRDPLLHVLWIRGMSDVYRAVTEQREGRAADLANVSALEAMLESRRRPLFAHLHLLGTHGPLFEPGTRVFSAGQKQTAPWMPDFYDDAVLEFAALVGRIVDALRRTGSLDDTILVIHSDHGMNYETTARIPLAIRFPRGEHRGEVEANAQGIDIAPTILDHLGIPQPGWMRGTSLLGSVEPCRPIVGIHSDPADRRLVDGLWQASRRAARIGAVSVVSCDRWFVATRTEFSEGRVRGHTGACGECRVRPEEIRGLARGLLASADALRPAAAPASPPPIALRGGFGVGVYREREGRFYLARSPDDRTPAPSAALGAPGDLPLAGDWDGDGHAEVGVYRPSESAFILFSSGGKALPPIPFGAPGDLPVVGDWDGDGTTTIGTFRPAAATFRLRNRNAPGPEDVVFAFGAAGDLPVSGDWNGDGRATIGTFRQASATFHLRNSNAAGHPDLTILFGTPDDVPVVGDWNGDGRSDLGVYRPALSTFFLTTRNEGGIAEIMLSFGIAGDQPVAGRW